MKNINKLKQISDLLEQGHTFEDKELKKLVNKLDDFELIELFNYCNSKGV